MFFFHTSSIRHITALCVAWSATLTWAASPDLQSIQPRGVQRATTTTLNLYGSRLSDVQAIVVYPSTLATAEAFQFTELTAKDDGHLTAMVTISPDCPFGEHAIRVRTATGMSTMRTLWVGPYPQVDEVEPNSDFDAPQKVDMNVTVAGVIENEDVDHYLVEAKKGQRLSVEIEGIRLGEKMFDPYVAILDAGRFELSASDDTALLLQDSIVSIIVPEDGAYILQVRESSYGGGGCRYRLHIGNFPRPRVAYPAGGQVGTSLSVRLVGDVAGPYTHDVVLPTDPTPRLPLFAPQETLLPPSPNVLRVVSFPNVLETEPNNGQDNATSTEESLPLALNGILGEAGDIDWFRIKGVKGQKFAVRVHARSIRSPLDSVLSIHRADGDRIAHNDDQGGPDSAVDFTVPDDGQYLVSVHDHLRNGGPNYVYRIEFAPVEPRVTSHIPRFGRDSQARQVVAVPRGNRAATLLNCDRKNFGGAIVYEAANLPEGVTLHGETVPSDLRQMPFVFEASDSAPLAGGLIDLVVRHEDASKNIRGHFRHHVVLVTAGNNVEYYGRTLRRLPLAVTDPVPFAIDLEAPKVPLVHNGTMHLKVVARRDDGFTEPITVRMLWTPPGVSAKKKVQIPAGQTEVRYLVSANGNAQTRTWKVVMQGEADAGKGQVLVSSALTPLTVATPYVGMKIQMAALERGEAGEIICKLEQHKPFAGKAVAELIGLPHQVLTQPVHFTKDDQQLVFPITTGGETPNGTHKNLFCRVVLQEHDTDIVHQVGNGGKLRIDLPPPPPPQAAASPKPKPKPVAKAPTEKRLTRLEKLRLQAKERAEAAMAGR